MSIDFNKVDNINFDGIDHKDYPDYCDAFIVSADYEGREATESELDEINENSDFVHEKLWEHLY